MFDKRVIHYLLIGNALLLLGFVTSVSSSPDADNNNNNNNNKSCSLLLMFPFAFGRFIYHRPINHQKDRIFSEENLARDGYSMLASALMAINHFNHRDAQIIPELAGQEYSLCNITLTLNETYGVVASNANPESVTQGLLRAYKYNFDGYYEDKINDDVGNDDKCNIMLGPVEEETSMAAGVLSNSMHITTLSYGSMAVPLTFPDQFYYTVRTTLFPDYYYVVLFDFLKRYNINYLYGIGGGTGGVSHFLNILEKTGGIHGVNVKTYRVDVPPELFKGKPKKPKPKGDGQEQQPPPLPPALSTEELIQYALNDSITRALVDVQESGIRTILIALTQDQELEMLAEIANKLNMLDDTSYIWIFTERTIPYRHVHLLSDSSPTLKKLLQNSGIFELLNGEYNTMTEETTVATAGHERFQNAWKSQGPLMVQEINSKILPHVVGAGPHAPQNDDYFQAFEPGPRSLVVYDSIIAGGLAACRASMPDPPPKQDLGASDAATTESSSPPPPSMSVDEKEPKMEQEQSTNFALQHTDALTQLTFQGASGFFRLDKRSRDVTTSSVGIFNVRLNPSTMQFEPVLSSLFSNGTWSEINPFVYKTGSTDLPGPPRVFEMIHIAPTIRIVSIVLAFLAMIGSIICAIFVGWFRKEHVIKVSQPEFLFLLCLGTFIMPFTTIMDTFDEGLHGWTATRLSVCCQLAPWFFAIGYALMYMALYCKLWRISQVLQFRRNIKVAAHHVLGPLGIALICIIFIMTAWSIASPLHWTREELEVYPPTSIGYCASNFGIYFAIALSAVLIVITGIAFRMAYVIRNVAPNDISDAPSVFITVFTHVEGILIGVPVIILMRNDVSRDMFVLVSAIMISSICFATLGFLIVVPKMQPILLRQYKIYRGRRNSNSTIGNIGGGGGAGARRRSTVHISGLSPHVLQNVAGGSTMGGFGNGGGDSDCYGSSSMFFTKCNNNNNNKSGSMQFRVPGSNNNTPCKYCGAHRGAQIMINEEETRGCVTTDQNLEDVQEEEGEVESVTNTASSPSITQNDNTSLMQSITRNDQESSNNDDSRNEDNETTLEMIPTETFSRGINVSTNNSNGGRSTIVSLVSDTSTVMA